jgi:response regulator RpfG family c-di-GMP phosphodiesterase/serine/threonine protein kinase
MDTIGSNDLRLETLPGSTNMLSPGRQLLNRLRDEGVILAEEWDSLGSEHRERISQIPAKDHMVAALADAGLITEFQAGRILACGPHQLVFGNYRILERLGAGGMGVVYRGEHKLMRRPVAIKVLQTKVNREAAVLQRFFAETRALAMIRHPNIVWAFDAGSIRPDDNESLWWHYLVMEFLEGSDLEKAASLAPLAPTKACDIAYQIAGALDETHARGLIHRDIKPSNIIVSTDGVAKLLDFGLALHFRQRRVTDPGTLLGSISFMAPEQVTEPATVDNRADVFGLGATLYFCLTGRPPFANEGPMTHRIAARLKEPEVDLRGERSDIPVELVSVLRRMMAFRRENRYPNAQSVLRALLPFIGSSNSLSAEIGAAIARSEESATLLPTSKRVLVVDDEPGVRAICKSFFKNEGFDCHDAADGEEALLRIAEQPFDLIVLDIDMPRVDGTEALRRLRKMPNGGQAKVIMMSGGISGDDLSMLLALGADDYLTKPLTRLELIARSKSALIHKSVRDRIEQLNQELLLVNAELEKNLAARKSDLAQTRRAIVLALAKIVESRSPWATNRMVRIAKASARIARAAARLPNFAPIINEPFLKTLETTALLHDIGKVALPDAIMKPVELLEPEERFTLQSHTTIGAETLAGVAKRDKGAAAFWQMAIDIARHHHERYDGKGYPNRLAGADIPLPARIVALADSYDTFRWGSSGGPPLPHDLVVDEIVRQAGSTFDPQLAFTFDACREEFRDLADADGEAFLSAEQSNDAVLIESTADVGPDPFSET